MSLIRAITTFSGEGLRKYGVRMLRTFNAHWSSGTKLHVYYEDWNPFTEAAEFMDNPLFEFPHLITSSDWLRHFKHRHRMKRVENYRFDAVRFAHKIAALLHAAEDNAVDYLIWLDGDIVTHADFHAEDLDTLLPKGELIAWLDRDRYYPECGFYILNCRHPDYDSFIIALRAMYDGDMLFTLAEWHDSYVVEQIVKQHKYPTKSLSGPTGFATHHPLVNGPLGQWFDHLKGARKGMGKTPKIDRLIQRPEEYWKS